MRAAVPRRSVATVARDLLARQRPAMYSNDLQEHGAGGGTYFRRAVCRGLLMDSGGGEPDRGFRIENEAGASEGDAIRDTGAGLMQASGPFACHKNARQRPFSKHDD